MAGIISGTLTIGDEHGTEKTLGPGSTLNVPGGVKHTTKCGADQDCVIFGYIAGKDDTKMMAKPTTTTSN